jgi:FkbM family methyltransferase
VNYLAAVKNRLRHRREERRCVALWSSLAGDHNLAFDVGANVGLKARALAKIFRRVIAFEPDPNCFSGLRRLSSKITRIEPRCVALGESRGSLLLHRSSNGLLNSVSTSWIQAVTDSRRFDDATWEGCGLQVPVETLENIIVQTGLPDFIKIDVEGYEEAVIKGMISVPMVVCFEFTPETLPSTLGILKDISDRWHHEANFCVRDTYRLELSRWQHPMELGSMLGSLAQSSALSWGDIYLRPCELACMNVDPVSDDTQLHTITSSRSRSRSFPPNRCDHRASMANLA